MVGREMNGCLLAIPSAQGRPALDQNCIHTLLNDCTFTDDLCLHYRTDGLLRTGNEEPEASAVSLQASVDVSDDPRQHAECITDMSTSDELDGPPDDLTYHIQKLQIDFVNWWVDWGEMNWETEFDAQLGAAQKSDTVCDFVDGTKRKIREGRDLLYDLKFLGEVSCNNTHDEIRDLFLQGYDMAIAITSQVKFFEIKLYQMEHLYP
jgi:hypothetical protein